jgi:hypothetical protein
MGKISIEPFLNTNLKAYHIKGVDHYKIYWLVTAKRRNTKIPSNEFNGLYSQEDFNALLSSDFNNKIFQDEKEKNLLSYEQKTLKLIVETQLLALSNDEFDTMLFSAFVKYSPKIFLEKYLRVYDIFQHAIRLPNYHIIDDTGTKKVSLYDWFAPEFQKNISTQLQLISVNSKGYTGFKQDKELNVTNYKPPVDEAFADIQLLQKALNCGVLYYFFDFLAINTISGKKNLLKTKYSSLVKDPQKNILFGAFNGSFIITQILGLPNEHERDDPQTL